MMNRHTCYQSFLRLFAVTCLAAGIQAQAQEDEKAPASKIEPQMAMLIECFELDHRAANQLIREYSPKAANAGGLRDHLGGMVKNGKAALVETVWMRSRSGQRAKSESIRETIYPTEFDPPEIPNTLGVVPNPVKVKVKPGETATAQAVLPPLAVTGGGGSGAEILMTSATPTAFETRNVGTTVETDAVLSNDDGLARISLAPEMISYHGRQFYLRPGSENVPWGVDHISSPLFYAMKTSLQMKAKPGHYNLLGMFTPPEKPKRKVIALLKMDLIYAN
ncbi:MAG: hypothetical protein P1U86_10955 [Verrucomicrobiales bacterium]|nr:hypothetical protein [Verrucomicrobiales bacterium]